MERMYNVCRVIENPSMINYMKRIQLNDSPMTHSEAVLFMSKQTKYSWCRDFLVEIAWQPECSSLECNAQTKQTSGEIMTDFIIGECLQSIVWPILKQIAANRKIKNKAK